MSSFISPSPPIAQDSPSSKDRAEAGYGGAPDSDSCVGQERLGHIEAAYQAMTALLIQSHIHGDFIAAADYVIARRKWEMAVLDSIKGDAA